MINNIVEFWSSRYKDEYSLSDYIFAAILTILVGIGFAGLAALIVGLIIVLCTMYPWLWLTLIIPPVVIAAFVRAYYKNKCISLYPKM